MPHHRRLPQPGEVVNQRYQILAERGGGAMGVLFQAHDAGRGHAVALKVLRPEILGIPEVVERLRREGLAISLVAHEHVVRIWDVGTTEQGLPFLSMEWLDGTDLGAILEELGSVPIHTAVAWVRQACAGLHEAHQRGIVHRDIKPANLFLARGPHGESMLKLIDFGVSKLDLGSAHLTQTHVTVGTPLYMSPEQVRALRDIDPRSDVWALGVVLFELISGMPPFIGESAHAVTASIVADPPQALDSFVTVPRGLAAVIERALAKKPVDRFPTVLALAEALLPYEVPVSQQPADLEGQATLVTELPPNFDFSPPQSVQRVTAEPRMPNEQPALVAATALTMAQLPPMAAQRSPPAAPEPSLHRTPVQTSVSRTKIIGLGVGLGLAITAIGVVIALGVRQRRELREAPTVSTREPHVNSFAKEMQARAESPIESFKPCVMNEGSMQLPGLIASRVEFRADLDPLLRDGSSTMFRSPGAASGPPGDTSVPLTLVSPLALDLRQDEVAILAITDTAHYAAMLGEAGVQPLDEASLARFVSVLAEAAAPVLLVVEGDTPLERLRDALRLIRKLPSVGVAVVPKKDSLLGDRAFECVPSDTPVRPVSKSEVALLANGLRAAEESCGRDHPFDASTVMTLRLVPGSSRGQACWESFERTSARGRACAIVAGKRLSAAMPITEKNREVTMEFVFRGQPVRAFCD